MTKEQLYAEALRYHTEGHPGKIEIRPTKPHATQYDLSLAYSPGVAAPSLAIASDPALSYEYTGRGNLVAVISNGTAVLGLGNIGPLAAKPVMEGKCLLFKAMAGISKEENLISPQIIDAITKMKRDVLRGRGVSLNIDEILICLAMSSTMNENAEKAMTMLPNLTRAEVHFTHIPSAGDMIGLRKLGINVTSEPKFPSKNVYNP